jgi:hypothetical protein
MTAILAKHGLYRQSHGWCETRTMPIKEEWCRVLGLEIEVRGCVSVMRLFFREKLGVEAYGISKGAADHHTVYIVFYDVDRKDRRV